MENANRKSSTVAAQYVRPNDGFRCTSVRGEGSCDRIPEKNGQCAFNECKPVPTYRWQRKNWRRIIAIGFLGGLAILLGSPQRNEFLAPGKLTSAHAQILGGTLASNRCFQCHTDFHEGALTQTQKCQACHEDQLNDVDATSGFSPHDIPRDELLTLSKRHSRARATSFVSVQRLDWQNDSIGCGECHKEHNGSDHDLLSIADAKCHACHQQQFASFNEGHPDFSDYPQTNDSPAVAFSHTKHFEEYFPKQNTNFECTDCHLSANDRTSVGPVSRAVAYESCAQCHDAAIRSSMADGLVVFQLPSLHVEKLRGSTTETISWPSTASGLNDGVVPSIQQLLLATASDAREWVSEFAGQRQLNTLDFDKSSDRRAAMRLMAETKTLLEEIAQDGQQGLRNRLVQIFSDMPTLDEQEMNRLVAGIPPDLFRQAIALWFDAQTDSGLASMRNTIVQPTSVLLASSGLRTIQDGQTPAAVTMADDTLLNDMDFDEENLFDDGGLVEDDLLGGNSTSLDSEENLEGGFATGSGSLQPRRRNSKNSLAMLRGNQHLEGGGWYIDQRRMAICYVPTGHADPWLSSWNALAARLQGMKRQSSFSEATSAMLTADAVGMCFQCHSASHLQNWARGELNTPATESWVMPWKSTDTLHSAKQFTKFDHGPHLLLPQTSDCQVCHSLNGHNDHFETISINNCKQCHREGAASNRCTTCHNYHVNDYELQNSRIADSDVESTIRR